jgi:C4-dicarboxylate-specific signal transduction histidine kinase
VAIKKLKPVAAPLPIPEGLYILPTGILLFQKSSQTVWANPAFEKQFGVVHSNRFADQPSLGLIRERPLSLPVLSMLGRHEGFVLDCLDGKKVPIELKVTQYGDASIECFLILVEDVSGKVELETQLIQKHLELQKAFQEVKEAQDAVIQSAKLASLGEMSSGIAHELNQPLQAILGFSQELLYLENLTDTGKEFLGDIVSGAKKMAEIIKSFRTFARISGDDYVETSIGDAVEEARRLMYHSLLQKGIEFEINIMHDLPYVLANPIQLEQVFVNLFSNARDAIDMAHPGRGTISVEVTSSESCIEVRVKDDGCGMSDETRQKIFDPFFTTKEVGKGTGLGLSISYGILQKLEAETVVTSKINQGTEFKIRFPLRKAITA